MTAWKQQQPNMPATMTDNNVLTVDAQMLEARAWTHKLRHDQNGSPTPTDAALASPTQSPSTQPLVVEASSKKHRFSLRRLFHHHHNDDDANDSKKVAFVPPVPIPSDFLTRERHGGVTVSGKRVPFTRDAHKRRKKVVKPMPRINEDRAQVPVSSSTEAYRRRAYYPAKKEKTKK